MGFNTLPFACSPALLLRGPGRPCHFVHTLLAQAPPQLSRQHLSGSVIVYSQDDTIACVPAQDVLRGVVGGGGWGGEEGSEWMDAKVWI